MNTNDNAGRRTLTCQYHCATCGFHASSERAWDLHRVGSYRDGTRRCGNPDDIPQLAVRGVGRCELVRGSVLAKVSIYCESSKLNRDLASRLRRPPSTLTGFGDVSVPVLT